MTKQDIQSGILPDHFPYPGTQEQREYLRRLFISRLEMSLSDCIDTIMSIICKRVVLDIVHVDTILHSRFGDYEDRGLSMEELITKEYGEESTTLIKRML